MVTNRTGSKGARRLAAHALEQGGERRHFADGIRRPVVEWNVAGSCTRPLLVTTEGKAWRDYYPGTDEFPGWAPDRYDRVTYMLKVRQDPYWVDMRVRCRKCRECLKARAHHWAERAAMETLQAPRTWFGTLTFAPSSSWATEARAIARDVAAWDDPIARRWDEDQAGFANRVKAARFIRMHQANGPLLTKWLKRIRKESGASLRYMLVAEAHKDGRPHYHALIHETHDGGRVLHKTLSSQWIHGFSQFKLADPAAAKYVCKYLAKSAEARIRASLDYGRRQPTPSVSGLATGKRGPRL